MVAHNIKLSEELHLPQKNAWNPAEQWPFFWTWFTFDSAPILADVLVTQKVDQLLLLELYQDWLCELK